MIEIIVIALLVFIAWQDWQRKKERQEFFDYIKAKDAKELKEIRETVKPEKTVKDELPDLQPMDAVTDEDFDKAIRKSLGRETLMEKASEQLKKRIRRKNG